MVAVPPDDITDLETVLGFIHTTKQDSNKASGHTGAALQLCSMMVKQRKDEDILLVNIVKKEENVEVLKAVGPEYVVNSPLPSCKEDILTAMKATGAAIAIDAIGGGTIPPKMITNFTVAVFNCSN